MAVRHFDGVDDNITFAPPAVGDHEYTFAVLMQKNGDTSSLEFVCGREAAGGGSNVEAMGFDNNFFGAGNDHQIVSADNGTIGQITVASDWVILVARIPDPSTASFPAPSFSAYHFDTGTWVHESPGHGYTVAAASPGGIMRVGYLVGLESFKAAFSLGTIGYWNVMFTTTEAEQLSANLTTDDWANVHPEVLEFLADFNQASTATAVTDLSGNGLDQTGITGTDVLTGNDPPGWTFGLAAGGTTFNQELDYTATGGYTEATVLTLLRTLTYAAGASYARLASAAKTLEYDAAAAYARATSVAKALEYVAGSSYGRRAAVTKALAYTAGSAAELVTVLAAHLELRYTAAGAASVTKRAEKTLEYVASAAGQLIAPQNFAAGLSYVAAATYKIGATVGLPEPLLRYPRNLRSHIRPPASIRRRRKLR